MDYENNKDDKFILMNMDDERSKYIAEVMGNQTCKKILDYLAETKEASEKDISDALNIPINTVEYNLNKLVKSGLVEKAKNFFWSRKGRKIDMYKLSRKHIIISPGARKPSLSAIKMLIPVFLVLVGIIAIALLINSGKTTSDDTKLKQFHSLNELKSFLKSNSESYSNYYSVGGMRTTDSVTGIAPALGSAESKGGAGTSAMDYSQTNIQVEGVDEPDIVKNDGKYIYTLTGNKIVIVNAYPADDLEVLSEINFSSNLYASNIFVNDDKLIVLANVYGGYSSCTTPDGGACPTLLPVSSGPQSVIYIYDISDKENPELEDTIAVEGSYEDSRMIDNYVYVISSKSASIDNPMPPVYIANGVETKTAPSDVYYFDYPDSYYVFKTISAINLDDNKFDKKVYLMGGSGNLYVSSDNIYLTYQKTFKMEDYAKDFVDQVAYKILPKSYYSRVKVILNSDKEYYEKLSDIQTLIYDYSESLDADEKAEFDAKLMQAYEDFQIYQSKERMKTIVHKINIDELNINYKGAGSVPGYILNQFSMDEYDGYFRIATTTGDTWSGTSLNHLYVLDKDLKIAGKVEDLAKGERIYSTRFIQDKAYIVTFRQIDPFYVIDLSNPKHPEVLGYLKIPGYSSYLHPYDENHIIGLGQENNQVKISLFDVSDFDNPEEVDKYLVDKKYSSSEAMYEHKAFLFDKEKSLLAIPVTYSEPIGVDSQYGYTKYKYFQGAFVFDIDSNSIDLKGTISHEDNIPENSDYYYGNYQTQVRRSLFMDDVLYTISLSKIKANSLDDLSEIKSVVINEFENLPLYYDYVV